MEGLQYFRKESKKNWNLPALQVLSSLRSMIMTSHKTNATENRYSDTIRSHPPDIVQVCLNAICSWEKKLGLRKVIKKKTTEATMSEMPSVLCVESFKRTVMPSELNFSVILLITTQPFLTGQKRRRQ